MSDVECIILDEDPPAKAKEMIDGTGNNGKPSKEERGKLQRADTDDNELADCDESENGTENLCLSDMQVLDEVKDDSSEETEESKNDSQLRDKEDDSVSKKSLKPDGTADGKPEAPNTDPYAYLTQGSFSSENFKIELKGLPKYFGLAELKKLLNETLKLGSSKIKPPRNGNYLFVCFRSEESKLKALEVLNGYTWKNAKLFAMPAKAAPDPLVRKRKLEAENQDAKKVSKPNVNPKEKIRQGTIPYWDIPYETQLKNKMEAMRKNLRQMGEQISNTHPEVQGWLKEQQQKYEGLPCELKPIRPSPLLDGYRNKCEFTVGLHPETKTPTVGFRLGSYARGEVDVYPADDLQHIPEIMKQVAKSFESLVTSSTLPPYNPEQRQGVWQTLAVRTTQKGQLMIRVVVHVEELGDNEISLLRSDIKQFFVKGAGKECNVDSLYFHPLVQKKKGKTLPPPELLHGEPYIIEELMGVKLRISPLAFFQVNTPAAEVLYSTVAELAHTTPDTTLLDICCGTGSIGLCLAKECGQVLGVELEQSAVCDAKANAIENGLTHCDFFAGTAESILGSVLVRASRPDFVAVLDPPRPGIGKQVIATIRRCQQIKKLVYMACNPSAAMHNFNDLARPSSKTISGHPFLPVCAIPVDLFPHTPHCELVVLLERFDPATLPPPPAEGLQVTVASDDEQQDKPPQAKKNKRKRGPRNRKPGNKPTETPSTAPSPQTPSNQANKGPTDTNMKKKKNMTPDKNKKNLTNLNRTGFITKESSLALYNRQQMHRLKGLGRGMGPMKAVARMGHNFAAREEQIPRQNRTMSSLEPRRMRGVWVDETPQMPLVSFGSRSFSSRGRYPELDPRIGRPSALPAISVAAQEAAEQLGRSWGSQVNASVLLNEEALRREEEEAVRKFKETFAEAIRGKRATYEAQSNRNQHERFSNFDNRQSSYFGAPSTSRQESENGGEKMIPLSAVSKLLENIMKGNERKQSEVPAIRDQHNFQGLPNDNEVIREVYVEKQIWKGHNDRNGSNRGRRKDEMYSDAKNVYGDQNTFSAPSTRNLPPAIKRSLLPPPPPIYGGGRDAKDDIQTQMSRSKNFELSQFDHRQKAGNFSTQEFKRPSLEQERETKHSSWQGSNARAPAFKNRNFEDDAESCGQEPWPYGNSIEESGSSPTRDRHTSSPPSPPRLYADDFPLTSRVLANSRGLLKTPFHSHSKLEITQSRALTRSFEKRTGPVAPSFVNQTRGSSRGGRSIDMQHGQNWQAQQFNKQQDVNIPQFPFPAQDPLLNSPWPQGSSNANQNQWQQGPSNGNFQRWPQQSNRQHGHNWPPN